MHILTEGQLSTIQLAAGAAWSQMAEHESPWPGLYPVICLGKFHPAVIKGSLGSLIILIDCVLVERVVISGGE